MSIPFTLSVIVIGAIIAQGLFAGIILLVHQRNTYANRFLGLLLVVFSCWLIDTFLKVSTLYQQDPDFYFLPIYYSLAFGPLLYFYTFSLTKSHFRLKRHHFFHFVPALIQGAFYFSLVFQSYDVRRSFWFDVHRPYTYNLEFNLSLLSLIIYALVSFFQIRRYQQWLKNNYSKTDKINLNWLSLILSLIILLCLFWMVDVYFREVLQVYSTSTYSAIAIGVTILVLAFGGLQQSSLHGIGIDVVKPIGSSPEKADIDPGIVKLIQEGMTTKKYYLAPSLTLNQFASHLNLPPRTVSQHINHGIGMPFIDFVNEYRVKEVIRHLEVQDLSHLTLLGIAEESGFNSKSTFNRIFKKFTGKSPKDYAKTSQHTH